MSARLKTVLITGAAQGLGLTTAALLAQRSCRVVLIGAGAFINGVRLPVDGGWLADASWDSLRLRTRG